MAGGASTPALVTAAARAGALGFLAAGYKSAAAMRAEIDAVAEATREPFGVNVFVPGAPARDPDALARYVAELEVDASQLDTAVGTPRWDDDDWPAKVADLIARPVAIVSFSFGCPDAEVVTGLHDAGSEVWVTVTDQHEAAAAAGAGADRLVVQGPEAGAHRATFTNATFTNATFTNDNPTSGRLPELLAAARGVTSLPIVAAGGIMTAADVRAAVAAGAAAVQCGTAFLRCPESGAHPLHKAALADPRFDRTAVTRAFSGRPARGLVNEFMREHRQVPAAYPEINNATKPLRAAAAAAGDAQRMSLWAGEGFRQATSRPAGEVVGLLCGG